MLMSNRLRRLLASLFLLGFAAGLAAQQTPTVVVGSDLAELRAAFAKEPANIGLALRIARRLLDDWRETTEPKEQRAIMAQVEAALEELRALGPDFAYPYRVAALQQFRAEKYDDFLASVSDLEKLGPLDYELRSNVVKAMLRQASAQSDGSGADTSGRKKAAAEYVGNWFDSGEAPVFSTTLAACGVWLVDAEFRDELLSIFQSRYEKDPKNVNLALSYAACLWNLGRNESAWRIVHDAETNGLADYQTGGRHPIVTLLHSECPEFDRVYDYDGIDVERLEALAKAHPQNASLAYRAAMNHKIKAIAAEEIVKIIDRRIEKSKQETSVKIDVPKLRAEQEEWRAKSRTHFESVIPWAQRAHEINPSVESVSLLLGDVFGRLGRTDEAIEHLSRTLALVPYFTQLRLRLAEIYRDAGTFDKAAIELSAICKAVGLKYPSGAQEKAGALLPVPGTAHEELLRELIVDKKAGQQVVTAVEAAMAADPRNPNLPAYLALAHYFAGAKGPAVEAMLAAERLGLCGEAGAEHPLATQIALRNW